MQTEIGENWRMLGNKKLVQMDISGEWKFLYYLLTISNKKTSSVH